MKIGELVSALEELGKAYRHAKKNEPAPCIVQLLKYLQGNEQLELNEFVKRALERKSQPKQPKKPSSFNIDNHVAALRASRSDGEFVATMETLKKAKPTVGDLKHLLSSYTGIPRKTGKKDELWKAIEAAYNAERRNERRERIAAETLPI
jgi:hypothetical protein